MIADWYAEPTPVPVPCTQDPLYPTVSAFAGGVAALAVGGIGVFGSIFFAWLDCKVIHVRYVAPMDKTPKAS